MQYITHRRFHKMAACGEEMNIPYNSTFDTIAGFIASESKTICRTKSIDAYMYFARNDDGNGIERGKLTYDIAYADRNVKRDDGYHYRFTDEEIEMLVKEYPHFLKKTGDYILFNYDFFNAEIEELRELHKKIYGR